MPAKGYLEKIQLSTNGTACTWLGVVKGNSIGEPAEVERLAGVGGDAEVAVFAGMWEPTLQVSGQGAIGLKTLLGYALRNGTSGNLDTFYMFTKDDTVIKKWSGCKVESLTIRGVTGKPVEFDATIKALDGTAVAAPTWATSGPLEQLSAFTWNGTAANIAEFNFGITNELEVVQYGNASAGALRKPSAINEGKIDYSYGLKLPTRMTFDLSADTVTGLASVVTCTNGTTTQVLTFAGCVPKANDSPLTDSQAMYEYDLAFTTVALT